MSKAIKVKTAVCTSYEEVFFFGEVKLELNYPCESQQVNCLQNKWWGDRLLHWNSTIIIIIIIIII